MLSFRRKMLAKISIFILMFLFLHSVLAFVIVPAKSFTRLLLHEIYTEQSPIEFAFLGASGFFRGINPQIVDENTGLNTFVLGSSNQTLVDAYYLLKEAYKYQTISHIALDIVPNRFYADAPAFSSAIMLDYMKLSQNKVDYFFNAVNYKDYFKTIFTAFHYTEQFKSIQWIKNAPLKLSREYREYSNEIANSGYIWYGGKGYVGFTTAYNEKNIGKISVSSWNQNLVAPQNLDYLDKIVNLCRSNNTDVIFLGVPTPMSAFDTIGNYPEYFAYIDTLSKKYDIPFYNFKLAKPSVFLPKEKYFTDPKHLNVEGASHFSVVVSDFITDYTSGTLNPDDYFYSSTQEMLAASKYVFSVWTQWDDTQNDLKALSTQGSTVKPEYAFLYKNKGDEQFTLYRDYSLNPYAEIDKLEKGKYIIRVQARCADSIDEYDQYYETSAIVK